jgi:hypothetical protein
MDILLSDEHDLEFDGNDLKLTTTESESLAQRLKIKLLTYQNEWYLDVEEGIPYFQSILGKNRAKETIDLIFKNAILSEPEVINIISFESSISPQRVYQLRFTVRSLDGKEGVPIELTI